MFADRAGPPRERGQALVETLVVAVALVPLALLVVLLGKYQSMQSATIAASRSLAFDCAARPQACADPAAAGWLTEAARVRHFERADIAIVSGAVAGTTANPLWKDRAGRPLLERHSHVGTVVSPQSFNAGLNTAIGRAAAADVSGIGVPATGVLIGTGPSGATQSPIGVASAAPAPPGAADVLNRLAGPARFGFGVDKGLLDARVQVQVAASRTGKEGFASLDPLSLTMRARTAILSDAWLASGPRNGDASTAARTDAGARLDALRETRITAGYQLTRWALDLMGAVGLEPSAGDFRYHAADPGAVPADRVGSP